MPILLGGVFIDEEGTLLKPAPTMPPIAPAAVPPVLPPVTDFSTDALVPPGVINVPKEPGVVLIPAPPFTPTPPAAPPVQPTIEPPTQNDDGLFPPSDQNDDGSNQQYEEIDGDIPNFDGERQLTAAIVTLTGEEFVSYVRSQSEARGLDALAVLANAYHEGLGGGIGDGGYSYGPWQMHSTGRLPRQYWYKKNDKRVQLWAWSKAGIRYALDGMAKTAARGKSGRDAVYYIVRDYEAPTNWETKFVERLRTYEQLSRMGGGAWAYLAKYATGVKVAPPTTKDDIPQKPVVPAGVNGTWRDLLEIMRSDVPGAGLYLKNVGSKLGRAVS